MARKSYKPVFAGRTPDDEKIVIYIDEPSAMEDVPILNNVRRVATSPVTLFIERPDGEIWALSPGSEVMVTEIDSADPAIGYHRHVSITSPEWTGTAVGSREDLFNAEELSWHG